jgi:hypothetical protein
LVVRPHIQLLLPCLLVSLIAAACGRDRQPASDAEATDVGLRLVFAETDGGTTTIWAARPADPADRTRLVRVSHDPDWGIRAALSPDGRRLAYTVMPPRARDPDRDAELMLLDFDARSTRRLVRGIDLRVAPVWMVGARAVAVQRRTPVGTGEIVAVSLDGRQRPLIAAVAGHHLHPAGVDPATGLLYVVDLDASGARLLGVEPAGETRELARLATGPVRGFAPAPAGGAIAFLALTGEGESARYRAHAVALSDGRVSALRPDLEREEDTGVTWTEQGVALSVIGDGRGTLVPPGSAPPIDREQGFDALVSASPDGRWLVVRSFAGGTTDRPGTETLELVDREGRRLPIKAAGGVTVIGWLGR